MPLQNDDFAARLTCAPSGTEVVDELISSARMQSDARVFLATLDFEIMTNEGKRYLTCEMRRHWIMQQFADYISRVVGSIQDFRNPDDLNVGRRLQMLAYSQFWECRGVQRLLMQLVRIANGREYDDRLLLDTKGSTFSVFQSMCKESKEAGLLLDEFLGAVYHNQIRNAFAHSEIWFTDEWIMFLNCDDTKDDHVPSLTTQTWDSLFAATTGFIGPLFRARLDLERELRSSTPYRVDLPNLARPFELQKDDRGYWSARPVR